MLYRKLTLGLALGGGGARGLAHIGVLKVLEAEGLRPDCLSGTSMGAFIAALYASGMQPDEIAAEAQHMVKLSSMVKLIVDNLNFGYMLSAENVQRFLRTQLGECDQFRDLHIPLALAAVDLLSAREVVLQEGDLIKAVNASGALPGVAQPVEWNGMRLVDGGSLNNVPSDLVRSMGAEVVVAVDVSPPVTDEGFWKEQRLPEIAAASWRSNAIMVAAITAAKQRRAGTDVLIRPDISARVTTLTGFKYSEQVILAGEQAARQALPRLKSLMKKRFRARSVKIHPAKAASL